MPQELVEMHCLGRTPTRRARTSSPTIRHPHTSNGFTEAMGGCLEHLRGTALRFRNQTLY